MSALKKSKSKASASKGSKGSVLKSTSASAAVVDADIEARFEGTDRSWAYTPPQGATLLKDDDADDAGEFDWDRICEDEDLELWVVRVPEAIKPKHLENIPLSLPSSSSKKSVRIGTVKRKTTTFDVWSIVDPDVEEGAGASNSNSNSKSNSNNADNRGGGGGNEDIPVGGEEMKGMACLLQRKSKKGKLYPAPKPFARHIVVAAQPIQPSSLSSSSSSFPSTTTTTQTSTSDSESTSHIEYKNPPRYSYPKEVLKHRYIPYGSTELMGSGGVGGGIKETEMDVDEDKDKDKEDEDEAPPSAQPPVKSPKKAGRKSKKPKGDEELEEEMEQEKEKEEESEKEKEKAKAKSKGKKRKGETAIEEEGVPAKKAKKSK